MEWLAGFLIVAGLLMKLEHWLEFDEERRRSRISGRMHQTGQHREPKSEPEPNPPDCSEHGQ